jgi:hypothetical protein
MGFIRMSRSERFFEGLIFGESQIGHMMFRPGTGLLKGSIDARKVEDKGERRVL